MSSPQTEKGFIRIATGKKENDVLSALIGAKLGGTEVAICLLVMRKTWGWNKKTDWISLTQYEKYTGRTRQTVVNAIHQLVKKNILVKKTIPGIKTIYTFNKSFLRWNTRLVKKTRLVRELVKKTSTTSKENLVQLVKKTIPTKETITKETIQKKYSHLEDLTNNDFQEIAEHYKVPLAFVRSKYEDMVLWKGEKSGRGRGRNWRLTLMNWVKRDAIKLTKEAGYANKKTAIDARSIIRSQKS